MGIAATDLDNLANCLSAKICGQTTSPYETISVSDSLAIATIELRNKLKNLTVGLEHIGQPPGEAVLPLTPGTQFALTSGEYRVEVYVDVHLIQEGVFIIQPN